MIDVARRREEAEVRRGEMPTLEVCDMMRSRLAGILERSASDRVVVEGMGCREIDKRGGIFISICKPLFVTLIVNKRGEYRVYKVLCVCVCVLREARISRPAHRALTFHCFRDSTEARYRSLSSRLSPLFLLLYFF